jgi:hypothetical protein
MDLNYSKVDEISNNKLKGYQRKQLPECRGKLQNGRISLQVINQSKVLYPIYKAVKTGHNGLSLYSYLLGRQRSTGSWFMGSPGKNSQYSIFTNGWVQTIHLSSQLCGEAQIGGL